MSTVNNPATINPDPYTRAVITPAIIARLTASLTEGETLSVGVRRSESTYYEPEAFIYYDNSANKRGASNRLSLLVSVETIGGIRYGDSTPWKLRAISIAKRDTIGRSRRWAADGKLQEDGSFTVTKLNVESILAYLREVNAAAEAAHAETVRRGAIEDGNKPAADRLAASAQALGVEDAVSIRASEHMPDTTRLSYRPHHYIAGNEAKLQRALEAIARFEADMKEVRG